MNRNPMVLPRLTVDHYGPISARKVGKGAYSYVLRMGDSYAVKLSRRTHEPEADIIIEIAILLRLRHPGIIRLVDVLDKPEINWKGLRTPVALIFPLASGTLDDYISRKEVVDEQQVMYQLLSAVSYIHSQGVIHRDITTRNILMFGKEARLCDFGSSKSFGLYHRKVWTSEITALRYRAIEVLQRQMDGSVAPYSFSADIWSLGCVFYEVLRGRPMCDTHTLDGQLEGYYQTLGDPRSPVQQFLCRRNVFGVPQERSDTDMLVERMLRYSPADRPTAHKLLQSSYWDPIRDSTHESDPLPYEQVLGLQQRPVNSSWELLINSNPEISATSVATMVEWIFRIRHIMQLNWSSLTLAIQLFCESLLAEQNLSIKVLPLRAAAALMVAEKLRNCWYLELSTVRTGLQSRYSTKQLADEQYSLLESLKYDVIVTTPFEYFETDPSEADCIAIAMASVPDFSSKELRIPLASDIASFVKSDKSDTRGVYDHISSVWQGSSAKLLRNALSDQQIQSFFSRACDR